MDNISVFTVNAAAGITLAVLLLLCVCRSCCALRVAQPFDVPPPDDRSKRMGKVFEVGLLPVAVVRHEFAACDTACVICLAEYAEGDHVRELNCRHVFHADCVDPWLLANQTCPLCMDDVLASCGADSTVRARVPF